MKKRDTLFYKTAKLTFLKEKDSNEDFILSESEVESEENGLDYDDDYECSSKKVRAEKEQTVSYGKDNYKWFTKTPELGGN